MLPCAIDRETLVWAAPRGDRRVRVFSRERGEGELVGDDRGRRSGDWLDHVRGVLQALGAEGIEIAGLDLAIASTLPLEAGLASSAALGLALVTAIDACAGLGLQARARVRIAHRSETGFVGVACGIMDPFVSGLARAGTALRIDCRSLQLRTLPLPPDRVRILIAHSGVTRSLADGRYQERRAEYSRALQAARRIGLVPADGALRDVDPGQLPALEAGLDPVAFRRARHVLSENQRVDATCAALVAGRLRQAGEQLRAGMRSLRDDFEVSLPELDALCAIADAQPGVYGSRLTGAGFGGCTVHLVAPEAAQDAARAIASDFARAFGRRPPLWQALPAAGASRLED